jgi:bifunctional oligoribonuclease and PAP phosphatase NrnA
MINTAENLSWNDWDAIARIIQSGKHFVITTHVNADPDALGSELALAEALRSQGKEALILNPTAVSKNYRFLDPAREIKVYTNEDKLEGSGLDGVFILDISRWERLGTLADPVRFCGRPKICIDHHPYSGGFADYHLVNTEACATAEIVYDLINFTGVRLDKRMAECLYTSMLADTGSFSFSNTNARSHKIASELLTYGVCPRTVFEQLYENHTPERLKFLGAALSSLRFDCDQKLAWMTISQEMLKQYGLDFEDIDGFVDLPRNCRSVLLSILFLEVEPDDVKISLRAKGDFNANRLASHFGGGGHNHASGIRLSGPLRSVEESVLNEARKAMQPFLS